MNSAVTLPVGRLAWKQRPLAELLRLSWPSVLSLLSVSTMTLVDSLFVGHLGPVQLAASGLGGVCVFAVLSFGLAVFGAAKVEVGLHHGAGNTSAVERSLGGFLRLALVLGGASLVVGELTGLSLPFLSADEPTGVLAGKYAAVRALSFPCALVTAAIGGWLQAQGDSKSGMRAALLANVTNVPLNYFFIFVLGWGLLGAGLSTVIAQFLEMTWLVVRQAHGHNAASPQSHLPAGLHWQHGSMQGALRALRIGLPTGLERVLDMIAFAAVPLLLAQLGPLHVAAHQIVLQIMLFSFLPLMALSETVSVLVSQALGAHEPLVVRVIVRLGLLCSLIYGALCATVCLGLATPLASAFSQDRALIELSASTLFIGAGLQLVNAAYNLLKGVLRGLSAFRFVALVTVGCAWIITPPFTYLIGVRLGWGVQGAWLVLCAEVTLGTLIMGRRVLSLLSRLHSVTRLH